MPSRLLALALTALLFASCSREAPRGRVVVLALDGVDPRAVELLQAEGKLPGFARLEREGASGPLRSLEPLLSPVVWTTIATGKTPDRHGITDFVAAGPGGEAVPVTRTLRRVKAVWNMASEAGRPVAVVGWWATWPPEEVEGTVVSDHAAYHFLFPQGGRGGSGTTWPASLEREIAPLLRRPESLRPEELKPFATVPPDELSRPFDFADDLSHLRWAVATAFSYRDIGLRLWRERRPDLELVYIEGTDSVSHLFGHLFRTRDLAGELARQKERYGGSVEAMYRLADSIILAFLREMDDDTTLVVLSDHGFRLGALPDDPSQTRDLRRVSERSHLPEGILYLHGPRVRRGARFEGAGILDVTPTLLALLGLPAAADMPGRVLEDALTLPPLPKRIASYEGGETSPPSPEPPAGAAGSPPDQASQAQLEHLKSLGYLGGGKAASSPAGDRTLADLAFERGDYREAARAYRQLLEGSPKDGSLHASLAAALGALGRYAEAEAELDRAAALEPTNPAIYHNRANLAERQGKTDEAVALYRRALLYDPGFEPSKEALLRLTGSTETRPSGSAAETRARALAEEAADLARRGDYRQALARLDEAQKLAPRSALIYQYRANVLYLSGNSQGAIAALEKALAIEPDNALFRQNLARLKTER
jgi:Flp pilus assembly protein TadD